MKTTLLAMDLLSKITGLELPETNSPHSLLYGLLGMLLFGVLQAVYAAIQGKRMRFINFFILNKRQKLK